MAKRLKQTDLDDLSALVDGEMPSQRAEEVRRLVEANPHWRDAFDKLQAVDVAVAHLPAPPTVPANLSERIVTAVRHDKQSRSALRWAAWLAPAAVAAAVVLLAVLLKPSRPPPAQPDSAVRDLSQVDRFAVENWDFVRDIDVLENYETIQAIADLESKE